MINKNELRIGNWITPNNKSYLFNNKDYRYIQIEGIAQDRINPSYSGGDLFDDGLIDEFDPIPLTPQILEACGFEKNIHNGFGIIKDYSYYQMKYVPILDGSLEDFGMHFMNYPGPCKYLHQLQNIYFDLTGKELQVDLKKLVYQKSI